MPVSRDREGQHRRRRGSGLRCPGSSRRATGSTVSVTWPWCVNLKALESRFLMTCCKRLASVNIDLRQAADRSRSTKSSVLGLGHVAEGALDVAVQIVEPQLADVDDHRARFDLRQVEDVVDQHQQIVAGRVDGLGELDLLGASGCRRGSCDSWSDRMSRLLSGVRSSCDMLARNSDLYFEVRASCLAFSSSAWRACSTSWFLRSTSWFWWASSRAFSCSSWLVFCSSSCRLCNSLGQRLRLLEQVLRAHVGFDGVEHDADDFGQLIEERLVRRVEALERRQFEHALDLPSKTTGSTMMFCGGASPRPDEMRM